jgi:hypothetical protein
VKANPAFERTRRQEKGSGGKTGVPAWDILAVLHGETLI